MKLYNLYMAEQFNSVAASVKRIFTHSGYEAPRLKHHRELSNRKVTLHLEKVAYQRCLDQARFLRLWLSIHPC